MFWVFFPLPHCSWETSPLVLWQRCCQQGDKQDPASCLDLAARVGMPSGCPRRERNSPEETKGTSCSYCNVKENNLP